MFTLTHSPLQTLLVILVTATLLRISMDTTTSAEEATVLYQYSVIIKNQAEIVDSLRRFFPKDRTSGLFEFDAQKSFSENRNRISLLPFPTTCCRFSEIGLYTESAFGV